MTRVVSSIAALALALAWSTACQAGPVTFEQVAGDAKWVAHVDVDLAKTSPVMKTFCDECIKDMDAVKKWEDVLKKVHGITAYGTTLAPHQGVLLINAEIDKDALLKMAEKAPDHKTMDYNGHEIHAWASHKDTEHAHTAAGTFFSPDLLVIASSLDTLKPALDVLDGKAPKLADKDTPLAEKPLEGTITLVRAIDLETADGPAHFKVLKLLREFDLADGQRNGEWFRKVKITTESSDVADKVKEVLQGFRAHVALHFFDQPGVLKLLDKVVICQDGKVVHLAFTAPVDDVAAQVPAICKMIKEHKAWHEAMCDAMREYHKEAKHE